MVIGIDFVLVFVLLGLIFCNVFGVLRKFFRGFVFLELVVFERDCTGVVRSVVVLSLVDKGSFYLGWRVGG